ncbi:MAG: hypothetical protein LC798_12855 [Chloroflexi bacterium]|nr:hypothetical protein [Chloroflexota bacterium]
MERNWTSTGEPYTSGEDRQRVERAIERLRWETAEGQKAMMPAFGIGEMIRQLALPKVSKIAIGGFDLEYPDGDSGGTAHYALYGVECHYRDGCARVYGLDRGSEIVVLRSDFDELVAAR